MAARAKFAALTVLGVGVLFAGCSTYQAFDSGGDLRARFVGAVGAERARGVAVPFELSPELDRLLTDKLKPAPSEVPRVDQVLDFIFQRVHLKYSLTPTFDAMGAYNAKQGNCLSFVNLFVGIARHQRLNPFYVEVTDYQRWAYRDGMVVSQGHIVAGLYVDGGLKTYDFLPYKPKGYRGFKPIDDLTATAHFYNNLGAEALMDNDLDRAQHYLQLASDLAPGFVKGQNNLGVLLVRRGELEKAEAIYRHGLEIEPKNVALLNNLAQLEYRRGNRTEAEALLAQIEGENNTNPFFFVYEGEQALARGDTKKALEMMVEALRRDSDAPEVQLGFVKVYLALGDVDKARHYLSRALRLDATNQEARRYAEMLSAGQAH